MAAKKKKTKAKPAARKALKKAVKKPAKKVAPKRRPVAKKPAKQAKPARKTPAKRVAKAPAPKAQLPLALDLPPTGPTPPPARHSAPPMHTPVNHPELDEMENDTRDEVFEIFRTYDRDSSGSIDRSEFSRLLEALGMDVTEDELAMALDIVDSNHSGRISWDEFKAWWSSR